MDQCCIRHVDNQNLLELTACPPEEEKNQYSNTRCDSQSYLNEGKVSQSWSYCSTLSRFGPHVGSSQHLNQYRVAHTCRLKGTQSFSSFLANLNLRSVVRISIQSLQFQPHHTYSCGSQRPVAPVHVRIDRS